MSKFRIGQKVRVNPDNDNENYNRFRDKVLTITHKANNTHEHKGYDDGVSPETLYSFNEIELSLYDYELIKN